MKTAEGRDAMVARVKVFFADHRTFMDVPEVDDPPQGCQFVPMQPPFNEQHYVMALYGACALGNVIGRMDASLIVNPDPL